MPFDQLSCTPDQPDFIHYRIYGNENCALKSAPVKDNVRTFFNSSTKAYDIEFKRDFPIYPAASSYACGFLRVYSENKPDTFEDIFANKVPIEESEIGYPSVHIKHEVCGSEKILINYDNVLKYNLMYNDLRSFDLMIPDDKKYLSPIFSTM